MWVVWLLFGVSSFSWNKKVDCCLCLLNKRFHWVLFMFMKPKVSLSGSWNKQFFFLSGSSETNHSSFARNKKTKVLILWILFFNGSFLKNRSKKAPFLWILETSSTVSCFVFLWAVLVVWFFLFRGVLLFRNEPCFFSLNSWNKGFLKQAWFVSEEPLAEEKNRSEKKSGSSFETSRRRTAPETNPSFLETQKVVSC